MYSIDRIENDIAILEDRETKEKKEVNISLLPSTIKEGSIIDLKDDKYIENQNIQNQIRTELQSRFNKLKK